MKLPKEARSVWNVRFTEDQLRVWVADDGTPIDEQRVGAAAAVAGVLSDDARWTLPAIR